MLVARRDAAAMRSRARRNCYSLGARGHAVGQTHGPTPLALVHLQNHAGIGRRMVDRRLYQEKVWPHLRNAKGKPVDQQTHFHTCGMSGVRR